MLFANVVFPDLGAPTIAHDIATSVGDGAFCLKYSTGLLVNASRASSVAHKYTRDLYTTGYAVDLTCFFCLNSVTGQYGPKRLNVRYPLCNKFKIL